MAIEDLAAQIVGEQFGHVFPPRPRPPLPDVGPRTAALRTFAKFLSTFIFRRTGPEHTSQTIAFQVPVEHIFIEQPDNVESLAYPSIVVVPGRGEYITGLGGAVIEDGSFNRFGQGTALAMIAEYVEDFTLEVWGAKRAERRAIMAGIETAMFNSDESYRLRIQMPDYFDAVASFWINESEVIDDADTAKNRRRGHFYMTLDVPVVQLISVTEVRPYAYVIDP